MSHAPPVVILISDDPALRDLLDDIVHSAGLQMRTFASADDFLSYPDASAPGCVVLDPDRSDCDGFDLQRRVAAERADLPIIVVTAQADVPTAVGAMKAGAFEFFGKPFSGDLLLSAIRHASHQSCTLLSDEAEMSVLRDRFESLSPRERQVMAGVVSGRLNKQVGSELGISEITVKAHRGKVMRKMGAGSLPELVKMAWRLHPQPRARYDERHGNERSVRAADRRRQQFGRSPIHRNQTRVVRLPAFRTRGRAAPRLPPALHRKAR